MLIRAGYNLTFDCPAPTPMLLMLDLHPSRKGDLVTEAPLSFDRPVAAAPYTDAFGNHATRATFPAGPTTVSSDFVIWDTGAEDEVLPDAPQHPVGDLPDEALVYLLASRYCDADILGDFAWSRFGGTPEGWPRVQAIVDFAHNHITFDYQRASASRTASQALAEGVGVCRDYAHLSVALCRAMNIPARYCTGYLGDIGIPPQPYPMDFSAWFQVWLGGAWRTFDARHNTPRIGRILMAVGRDATDVALTTSFGAATLARFEVFTDEVEEEPARRAAGALR